MNKEIKEKLLIWLSHQKFIILFNRQDDEYLNEVQYKHGYNRAISDTKDYVEELLKDK